MFVRISICRSAVACIVDDVMLYPVPGAVADVFAVV